MVWAHRRPRIFGKIYGYCYFLLPTFWLISTARFIVRISISVFLLSLVRGILLFRIVELFVNSVWLFFMCGDCFGLLFLIGFE